MISAAHRRLCRVLGRLFRETQRRDFGLDFIASRARMPADVVHRRCLELRGLGIVSLPEDCVVKIELDFLPIVLAA